MTQAVNGGSESIRKPDLQHQPLPNGALLIMRRYNIMKKKNISSMVKKAAVVCCAAAMCIAGGTVSSLAAQENEQDADVTQQESEAQIAGTDIRYLTLGYKIVTPESGRFWFETSTDSDDIKWQLLNSSGESFFYGEGQTSGEFYYNSSLGTGKASHTLDLSKGTYYFRVYSERYNDSSPLAFSIRTAFTSAHANDGEPNNNYAQATALGSEGTVRGQFAVDDSDDIYKINISKKTRLSVSYKSDYTNLGGFYIYNSDAQNVYGDYLDPWEVNTKKKSYSLVLNPGSYYIQLSAASYDCDDYSGPYTLTYTIKQKITADNISFNTQNYKYDGKTKNPGMSIMDDMGRYLVYGTDYVMSTPGGRTNVGTYTYKFSFKGDYTGYAEKSIYITPQALGAKSVKLSATKTIYNGYIIYRSTDGGSYRRVRTIKSGNTKSYFDKGAKARWTDYSYKVVVYKKVNGKTYKSSSSPEKTISRY